MKKLINRLVCLIRGHEWKKHWGTKYIDPYDIDDAIEVNYQVTKCTRCGKVKEEWV